MPKLVNKKPAPAAAPEGRVSKSEQKRIEREATLANRPVLHPEIRVELCLGDKALTVERMKAILGWEEETDRVKFGNAYDLVAPNGNKVRLRNNTSNRPFDEETAHKYAQDTLNRVWADSRNGGEVEVTFDGKKIKLPEWTVNGETIIVGRHGASESAQHRCCGWIFAEYLRTGKESARWRDKWPGPITVEAIIVYGVSEHPHVIRTIDNVRTRSAADVFYTQGYFARKGKAEREAMTKALGYALSVLWRRTGSKHDAHNPDAKNYLSNSAACDFVERHGRLLTAVSHVCEENGTEGRIRGLIPLGTAAAMLYLMGCAASDGDAYRNSEDRGEAGLDWSLWDRACEFWVELAGKSPKLQAVRNVVGELADTGGASAREKTGVIVKAWNLYRDKQPISAEDVRLEVKVDEDGNRVLVEPAANMELGGLDVGDGYEPPKDDEAPEPDEPEEGEAEIEQRKAAVSAEKNGEAPAKAAAPKPEPHPIEAEMAELRKLHPEARLLFVGLHSAMAYGDDADQIGKVLRTPVRRDRLPSTFFFAKDLEENLAKLAKAGISNVVQVQRVGGVWTTVNANGKPMKKPAAAKPKAAKKPAAK